MESKPPVKLKEGLCLWKRGDTNTKVMYRNRQLSEEFDKHQHEIDDIDMKEESDCQLITDGYDCA